jgi:hypothetical protein
MTGSTHGKHINISLHFYIMQDLKFDISEQLIFSATLNYFCKSYIFAKVIFLQKLYFCKSYIFAKVIILQKFLSKNVDWHNKHNRH